MAYRKINVELVVFAEEADSVVAELNSAVDRLEDAHTIFGGGIEIVAVQHSGTRRKSALMHTLAAADTAAAALKLASQKVAGVYKKVI
jgi:exonuclease VII small subunit